MGDLWWLLTVCYFVVGYCVVLFERYYFELFALRGLGCLIGLAFDDYLLACFVVWACFLLGLFTIIYYLLLISVVWVCSLGGWLGWVWWLLCCCVYLGLCGLFGFHSTACFVFDLCLVCDRLIVSG